MMKNKKGMGIGDLQTIGISFVVIAIVLGLGASVLTDIQSTQASTTLGYNISGFGLISLNTLGKWLPTIALVAVVAIIWFYALKNLYKTRSELDSSWSIWRDNTAAE